MSETLELGYYEVHVEFIEQATITLIAASAEAATELVKNQYADKLKNFEIISVEYLKPVEKEEGTSIH